MSPTPSAESQIRARSEIFRPIAHFKPSVWGDRFANYEAADDSITRAMQEQVEELKVIVRREVFTTSAAASGFSHQLRLIDAVQRLGVAYHFEEEIEQALERVYATNHEILDDDGGDLYNVALRFRLLRQHGYNISCADIFNQYKDASGHFKESLASDVAGMLSFYEAAHLRVHGEELLEEALVFTTTHLEAIATLTSTSSRLKAQITDALEQPIIRTLERMGAPRYMSTYQAQSSRNKDLLKFAKLDFNLVQCSHKKELSELIRWYKEVDFERKFPFVRDRMVESFWIAAVCWEPQYVYGRNIVAKLIELVTVLDDIYDAYGTYEEIVVLAEAIQRWDGSWMDQLPDYIKPFYQSYLDALDEINEEMIKQGRSYRVPYAKQTMKMQSQLYFAETTWLHEAYTPKIDEYLSVAVDSIGNTLVFIMGLLGMGDIVTKKTFEWVNQNPRILRASNTIFRLKDDIAGHKFDKERGHIVSSVDCYMKQHGVSKQETFDVFNKQIVNFWKDINEEILRPTVVPRAVLNIILNQTRTVDLLFKRGDGFTHGGKLMEDMVTSLFIDPVPL